MLCRVVYGGGFNIRKSLSLFLKTFNSMVMNTHGNSFKTPSVSDKVVVICSLVILIVMASSCRHFVPGFERNLPDDLIRAIAEKNGVIMVNFCTQFLDSVCLKNTDEIRQILESRNLRYNSEEGNDLIMEFAGTHRLICGSRQLVDHIEHVIKVAGIECVGLGSDFDGVGPLKPSDVPDVSGYPVVVYELLKRGYSEGDIEKILAKNFLRVWEEVQKTAVRTSLSHRS